MIKLPDFKEPIQPTDSKILDFKNSTLFLISIIVEIINITGSIIAFKTFDKEVIIIIILGITCLILFVDIIVLYIKDRENYFKNVYLTNMYMLLIDNLKDLQTQTNDLQNKTTDMNKSISSIKAKTS